MPRAERASLVTSLLGAGLASFALVACTNDEPDQEPTCLTPRSYGDLGEVLARINPATQAYQTLDFTIEAGPPLDQLTLGFPAQGPGVYSLSEGVLSVNAGARTYQLLSGELTITERDYPRHQVPVVGSMRDLVFRESTADGAPACRTEVDSLSFAIR